MHDEKAAKKKIMVDRGSDGHTPSVFCDTSRYKLNSGTDDSNDVVADFRLNDCHDRNEPRNLATDRASIPLQLPNHPPFLVNLDGQDGWD